MLAPVGDACTFNVGFDLPRKVLRRKVVFALSFPANDRLGPLAVSQTFKVKKTKKP